MRVILSAPELVADMPFLQRVSITRNAERCTS